MKTTTLLLALSCFSLLGITASASSPAEETKPLQLPAYVVTEQRQTSAEQEIKRNVDALRSLAAKRIKVEVALPVPDIKIPRVQTDSKAPKQGAVVAGV